MEDEFNTRIGYLSSNAIESFYDKNRIVGLNNVLEGFETDFFTIFSHEEFSLNDYSLMYIGDYKEIRGLTFKSSRLLKDRDIYTYRFAQAIENDFPELNSLVIFNTFQSLIEKIYENFGILCLPDFITNLEGSVSLIMPNRGKRGVDSILRVDILEFYRSYFTRENLTKDKQSQPKVYLMYDKKENLIKIGKTKNKLKKRRKGVAEPTLRASDPMIEIITAWEATKELETKLHLEYDSKRIRGEWFDLRVNDLQNIDELTLKYNMIEIF